MNKVYDVHIACIGDNEATALALLRANHGVDEVVLLNNRSLEYVERERRVRSILEDARIPRVSTESIDIFDFQDISEKLIGIVRHCRSEHPGCRIHFNITAGTNVVGGAMCTVAMRFSGTDVYYLKYRKLEPVSEYDEVIQVELADDRSLDTLLRYRKTAEVLCLFSETDSLEHHQLLERSGLTPSTLTYHTKRLMEMGLLDRGGPGTKVPVWTVSDKGRAVLDRLTLIDGRGESLPPPRGRPNIPLDGSMVSENLLTYLWWKSSFRLPVQGSPPVTCKRTSFAIYVDLWSVSFTICVFPTR